MIGGTHAWSLVGRTSELDRILDADQSAVVIVGDAGVGKSRLAREALEREIANGSAGAWIKATRTSRDIALGAFASLIPLDARSDDPFQLIQGAIRVIRERATGRRLVIVIDDAQWLDSTSATLALQIALEDIARLIVTIRSDEGIPDAVASLCKDAGAERIQLGTLNKSETTELIKNILDGPVDRATRSWIWRISRGNALYATELILSAQSSGALQLEDGLWVGTSRPPVSETLTELISDRLSGLKEDERRAINLLAVGEPLRLEEMLTLSSENVLLTLESRSLISVETEPGNESVRLSHPLYGDVLRDSLTPLRLREIRRRLLETVEARVKPDPDDAVRVARWALQIGDSLPVPRLLAGATAANMSGDPDFGADLAQRALERGGGAKAALILARSHTIRRRHEDARAVLAAAESLVDDTDTAVAFLDQSSEVLYWGLRQPEELRQLLDRASSWWDDDVWQTRLEPFRSSLTSFENLGLVSTLTGESSDEVRPYQVASLFYSGHVVEAQRLSLSLQPAIPFQDLDDAIAVSLSARVTLESGEDWPALECRLTSIFEQALAIGDHAAAGQTAYALAELRVLAGRYADAFPLLQEADIQLDQYDPVGFLPVVSALQIEVACARGDADAAMAALARCEARLDGREPLAYQRPYVVRARAWMTWLEGDPPRAQNLLLDVAKDFVASPIHAARLVYEALRVGASARQCGEFLVSFRERCDAELVACYADQATAQAAGDGRALLSVVNRLEQIGANRYAAEAAAAAATAFAKEGRDSSARSAAARSRALVPEKQGGSPPAVEGLDDAAITLTSREKQLARLAAQGLSNSEIADRLFLSVRTIESHLYRAMQKLGITDRRDLAAIILGSSTR